MSKRTRTKMMMISVEFIMLSFPLESPRFRFDTEIISALVKHVNV